MNAGIIRVFRKSAGAAEAEIVPGVAAAVRRRFLDNAYAFMLAADLDLGCTRFAYSTWESAGGTDNGTFGGQCRGLLDGDLWRPAEDGEHGRLVATFPVLESLELIERQRRDDELSCVVVMHRYRLLEAVDLIAVDFETGAWRTMTGLADDAEIRSLLRSVGISP